jgi:hypothetical protein
MGFWDKLRQRRLRKKLMKGEFELTISGQYFVNYCKKIAAGVWTEKDYIYAYDEELMHMVNRYNTMEPEFPISRKNMAKVLLAFVGNKGVKE